MKCSAILSRDVRGVLYFIVVGSRRLMPPDAPQPKAYCTNPGLRSSYLHRQVSPPETLVVKGGTTWARNGRRILPEKARLPPNIQGNFTCRKSTTWDKRLYFPSEGRRAEDFFRPEKSDGFGRFVPKFAGSKARTLPLEQRSRYAKV